MNTVDTIFGRLARDDLDVTERITEDFKNRVIQTVWTLRRDITVDRDGEQRLLEFVFPPMQNPDGSPIPGSERVVRSVKGEIARSDAHVMAKRGVELLPEQGILNS